MRLAPILKERLWGGQSIEPWLGLDAVPRRSPIGEAWLLADLPPEIRDGQSIVASGPCTGMTIEHLRRNHQQELMGRAEPAVHGGLPLLVKVLDAQRDLSVQVHPDAEYADKHPGCFTKSEVWHVLAAKPHARILAGTRSGVTAESFAAHARSDSAASPEICRLLADLEEVPASAGDTFWLPSGTCHALGAGLFVAEVQTPSDTTFRLYDWGRTGTGRPLHVEEGLRCCTIGPLGVPANSPEDPSRIVDTEHFTVDRIQLASGATQTWTTKSLPEHWLVIQGEGSISGGTGHAHFQRGSSVLVPAACPAVEVQAHHGVVALRTRLPARVVALLLGLIGAWCAAGCNEEAPKPPPSVPGVPVEPVVAPAPPPFEPIAPVVGVAPAPTPEPSAPAVPIGLTPATEQCRRAMAYALETIVDLDPDDRAAFARAKQFLHISALLERSGSAQRAGAGAATAAITEASRVLSQFEECDGTPDTVRAIQREIRRTSLAARLRRPAARLAE